MLAQSTLRLRPPDGYGQAARLLRGPVDPKLSPPASDTPPPDEVTVRTVEDVTRGLGLSDASVDRVQALADSGAAPFGMGQSIRGVLAGDNLPAALVLEVTRRATRYAKTKRAAQPRPVVGTVAALALRKSCDDDAAPVIGPPPTNNRAVHPFVGTVRFHGLPLIRLENLKGSTRSGADADGNAWSVTMPAHYGEFARSEGADGDPVDVFVGPNRHAPRAYVVHLQNPVTGEHDEDKVFLGLDSAEAARACFAAAYDRNDLKMGPVRTLTVSELAEWLAERENRGQKIEAGRLLAKSLHLPTAMRNLKDRRGEAPVCGCGTQMRGCRCKVTATHDGWLCPGCGAHGGIEAAKRTPADLRDAVEKSAGAPASQTYGTPANMPTPKAAEPPPAPPPVAKPHHHAEPLQLPTRPTKKFPPPSHPKPTKAPMKLMSTPPEMTKAQRHEAADLLADAGLSHEVEIPEWLALGIDAGGALTKGAGHKYIRRVPRAGGGFRYFYRVSGGKGGVGHESEFEVGAAFRVKDAGREGHFHVTAKAADGTLTIKHDETGATHTLSASALRSMLHTEHAEAIGAHREKLAQDIKAAREHGASPKQIARLEAEAAKHGQDASPTPEPAALIAFNPGAVKSYPVGTEVLAPGGDVWFRRTPAGWRDADGLPQSANGIAIRTQQWREETKVRLPASTPATTVNTPAELPVMPAVVSPPPAVEPSSNQSPVGVSFSADDIPLDLATAAHSGTSHVPERRAAQHRAEYVAHMEGVVASMTPLAKTPEQKEDLRAELERYRDGYIQRYKAWLSAKSRTMSPMVTGPARFPTDSNNKRMDTEHRRLEELMAFDKSAQAAIRNKLSPRIISSDAGNAAEQIQKKLDTLKQTHATMKAANVIIRGKGTPEQKVARLQAELGISEVAAHQALEPDFMGRVGFPDYAIKNNAAEIKRLEARVAQVTSESARGTAEHQFGDVTVTDSAEDNRIKIQFPGKPSSEVIAKLKSNGFKWAPSEGVWQRLRNDAARYALKREFGFDITETQKSMRDITIDAQRHEADALLKASGAAPPSIGRPRKGFAELSRKHEHMQKLHTKAADEAADRGDGALSKLHADAAEAHTAAAHAHGAGLSESAALTKKAADATRATLPQTTEGKGNAKQTTSTQAEAQGKVASGTVTEKPNAGAQAAGVGGRSKEGLKVIAIGPKGGKIVGYTTKDGKQKAIYEGSAGAEKLAATVATHAPEPAKPEAAAPEEKPAPADAKPEPPADAAPATDAPATDAGPEDATPADQDAAAPEGQADAPAGQDDAAGGAPAEPPAPTEPIDDKPLSPDEPPGGTPTDAPSPDELGSASPKTDSPEARHAEEIAKLRGQVEDAHKKLEALAHHIDTSLVPMYNNLKGQARAAHRNPSPSVVGWLLAQIGRFAAFVLGLHEDKGKVTSATDVLKTTEKKEPPMKEPTPAAKPKPPQTRVIEKSITTTGRPLSKASPADLEAACVRVLVTLQAVERLHHAAHLQAKGPESYSDHLLFQRLYTDVQHEIDGLSEKMVAAFGDACVDAGVRSADAADVLAEWVLSSDVLGRALGAELDLQRAIADALGQDPSPGLENFLQGLADAHETPVYLLQQRMSPAVEKSMRETTSRQAHAADALLKSATSLR